MNNLLLADGVEALPKTAAKVSRKRWLVMAAGAAALLAMIGLCAEWFVGGRYVESTDDAYVGGNVTDIAPQVSGVVSNIAVLDDQFVHKGDLLMQIDNRDFAAALAKARAEVAGDRAALANLDATAVLQASMIAQAEAESLAAQAQAGLARSNRARYASLAAANAGSRQDAQTADANDADARAGVQKAAAALAAARAELDVIATQKAQAQAALQGALADETTAAQNLGYTTIWAPFDGMVGNRSAHLGGYVAAGAQAISIVPASGLWVDANFKEDQLARIRPGERVSIVADIDPDVKITGHVQDLAPASGDIFSVLPAENATGNFTKIVQRVTVRITLDGAAGALGLLRPGLSVTASVDTK
jgi:membrane fusion protein (multidrug efflux system)